MHLCRSPTKLIGGFLEDSLETGAANNSDTYKMLRRESKLSKCLLFITNFTNMFVFVSIYRKSASVIGLKTRKSNSLLAMTLGSP